MNRWSLFEKKRASLRCVSAFSFFFFFKEIGANVLRVVACGGFCWIGLNIDGIRIDKGILLTALKTAV